MEDQPESITNNCGDNEIIYEDFVPRNDGHVKPHYESFRTLVDRANMWLKLNTQWKVKTCETVTFVDNDNVVATSEMSYMKQSAKHYVRVLRLWLQRCPLGEEKVHKIGYINLIPKISYRANLSYPEYERLGDVVMQYNEKCQSSPIPGRIISIETPAYKVRGNGTVDPEFTHWTEQYGAHYQFVLIIRIFYEVGEPMMEKIGFQDFIPEVTSNSCLPLCKEYQSFSDLTYKASRWCLRQTNLTICSSHFLMTKLVEGTNPDTTKMSYVRHGMAYGYIPSDPFLPMFTYRPTAFLRILRIAFVRLKPGVKVPFPRFTCKSFIPELLQMGVGMQFTHPQFETLQETVQKASEWIKKTGANVVSIETSDGRLYKKGAVYSSDVTYYATPSPHDKYHSFVIRVYVDGDYSEECEENKISIPSHACCCIQ